LDENSGRKGTLATSVYDHIRLEIITATLIPKQKLRIRSLCDRFNVGISPVREALSRLSSEGLVELVDHRGFAVAPLSGADLDGLVDARCWLNVVAIRESIARGDAAWEENIVVSFHRLLRTPRNQPENEKRNPDWEQAHSHFHASLLAGCGSTWMIGYCQQLFEAAERYRNVARLAGAVRFPSEDEHRAIMEATIARDSEKAGQLLTDHYRRTADLVRKFCSLPQVSH
jgi:GntR family carbon starvation induced transcriptional regulator